MFLDRLSERFVKSPDYTKKIVLWPKVTLMMAGLWPYSKNFRAKGTIACFVLIPFIIFLEIGVFYYVKTVRGLKYIIYPIMIATTFFESIYKLLILRYKITTLRDLVDDITKMFWPYDLINEKQGRSLKQFYYIITILQFSLVVTCVILITFVSTVPLFSKERILVFPTMYPFEWQKSPIYELIYITQVITTIPIILGGGIATDCIFISSGASATAQYRILQQCFKAYNTPAMLEINDKLRKFQAGYDYIYEDKHKEYFVRCVRHHLLLKKFTNRINDLLGFIALLQMGNSIVGICATLLLTTNETLSSAQLCLMYFYMYGYLNQLLLYCATGNLLFSQASSLPSFIYGSNWKELTSKEMKRDIMFTIQHSQKFPQLSAFGFYDINMDCFLKLLKFVFSVYTLFSRVSR